jgi:oligopeptide/dipeptide ABC transporter ATP-binding protein
MTNLDSKLLDIRNLSIVYRVGSRTGKVVEKATLHIAPGEVLGLAGESGCGKSTLAWSILRLLPGNARFLGGTICLEGRNLLDLSEREMNREIRGRKVTMIIQNTKESLNPVFTVGVQMSDLLGFHEQPRTAALNPFERRRIRDERRLQCVKMLAEMEIAAPDKRYYEYPHQFSGGMKQRVIMAMNFMASPALLIADEPTTGLDVSVEAYVLDLFKNKVKQYHTSVLYITHNLRILSEIANRVAVMYAGTIVEQAPVEELFRAPLHPYTQALIRCLPEAGVLGEKLQEIPGQVPSIFDRPDTCKFLPRCPCSDATCATTPPPDVTLPPSHFVLCHHPQKRCGNGAA